MAPVEAEAVWVGLANGKILRLAKGLKKDAEVDIGDGLVTGLVRVDGAVVGVTDRGVMAKLGEQRGRLAVAAKTQIDAAYRALALVKDGTTAVLAALTLGNEIVLCDLQKLEGRKSLEPNGEIIDAFAADTSSLWYATQDGRLRRLPFTPSLSEHEAFTGTQDHQGITQIAAIPDGLIALSGGRALRYTTKNRFEPPVAIAPLNEPFVAVARFGASYCVLVDAAGGLVLLDGTTLTEIGGYVADNVAAIGAREDRLLILHKHGQLAEVQIELGPSPSARRMFMTKLGSEAASLA